MKRKKIISLFIVLSIIASIAVGCGRSQTGSKEADNGLKAFNEIVKNFPEKKGFHKALSHWGFKLPTGEKFEWTKNTAANKADFAMVMLADPFIKAGLDVNKLNKDQWIYKPAGKEDGQDLPNLLIKPYNIGDKNENSNGSEDAFRRLLKADTSLIKYDNEEQKYRLLIGEGYEVQWKGKLGAKDNDMVFIIKAQPLIDAGLDINKLTDSGWSIKEDILVKEYKLN